MFLFLYFHLVSSPVFGRVGCSSERAGEEPPYKPGSLTNMDKNSNSHMKCSVATSKDVVSVNPSVGNFRKSRCNRFFWFLVGSHRISVSSGLGVLLFYSVHSKWRERLWWYKGVLPSDYNMVRCNSASPVKLVMMSVPNICTHPWCKQGRCKYLTLLWIRHEAFSICTTFWINLKVLGFSGYE